MEGLSGERGDWSCEMKTDVSFLFNVLVFAIVLRFAETLHESFESTPMPVVNGQDVA